ncbi:uncharacterized protein LOC128556635 [Mercenaria mercenaria]|uniref:uncharacterized protein LOC128556635 n=1 Tax=Mercenaria mercenaria TaxID=6596 RepID=UPI00234E74E0|nr:uncharacterized protein LOC128556635 [Mercenaria mercenaria]
MAAYYPDGYKGCYVDKEDRILEVKLPDSQTNSGNNCKYRCTVFEYQYAGTEFATECFCGNKHKDYEKTPDSECNMTCSGNVNEEGNEITTEQQLTNQTTQPTSAGNRTFNVKSLQDPVGYIGCYKDDKMSNWLSYQRVLHTKLEYPDLNCAAKCKEECKKMGFRYAGTESGEECFCGNEINQNPDKVPDTECNVPCPGQKDENCGGYWLISIYDTSKTMKDRSGPTTVTGDDFDQATSRFPLSPAVTVSPTQAEGTQGLTTPTTATDEIPTEASDPVKTELYAIDACNTYHLSESYLVEEE